MNDKGDTVNELIELLKSRVGVDDAKAQSAAQTVIDFLKQRLPAPVASHLDGLLSGSSGKLESAKGEISDILGKKSA